MKDYKISYIGDKELKNMHHIGIDCDGCYYSVIFGEYVNGSFCYICNWNIACELAEFSDMKWNEEVLSRAIKNDKVAKAIALVISEFA